jgi:Uma2 family endonuclease
MADVVVEDPDQRVVLYNVTYEQYLQVADAFDEDQPALRLTYADGVLEIMTPGRPHEHSKKTIARLLELYALEREIRLYGIGNLTMRRALAKVALEPDECYCVGADRDVDTETGAPDIAIEVVISHRMNKLPIYGALGVREVWVYQRGQFTIHRLVAGAYQIADSSQFFPELDLSELAEYAGMPDQDAAIRAYRARLSG